MGPGEHGFGACIDGVAKERDRHLFTDDQKIPYPPAGRGMLGLSCQDRAGDDDVGPHLQLDPEQRVRLGHGSHHIDPRIPFEEVEDFLVEAHVANGDQDPCPRPGRSELMVGRPPVAVVFHPHSLHLFLVAAHAAPRVAPHRCGYAPTTDAWGGGGEPPRGRKGRGVLAAGPRSSIDRLGATAGYRELAPETIGRCGDFT
jgi:hypothetical protein